MALFRKKENNKENTSHQSFFAVLFTTIPVLMICSVGIVDIATDIYLPIMPLLVEHFATSEEMGALTISCYLFSFCLSGPIYGPLSDALGRRKVLLFGMSIFTLFSAVCAFSWNIYILILARFFQGIGGGVAWILSLAIVKDVYPPKESMGIMAKISLVTALSPAAAPILGGYVGALWGWPASFYIVVLSALPTLYLLIQALPETLPLANRQKLSLKTILWNYRTLCSNAYFMGYTLISALMFASLFSYISITPFFFIKELSMSMTQYGYHQMALLIFYMVGSFLNKRFAITIGVPRFLSLGLSISLLGCICLICTTLFQGRTPILMTGTMGLVSLGIGIVFASTTIKAMDVFPPHMGGAAAALLSAIEMLLAAVVILITGALYANTMFPVAVCITSLVVCSCLIISLLHNYKKKYALTQ